MEIRRHFERARDLFLRRQINQVFLLGCPVHRVDGDVAVSIRIEELVCGEEGISKDDDSALLPVDAFRRGRKDKRSREIGAFIELKRCGVVFENGKIRFAPCAVNGVEERRRRNILIIRDLEAAAEGEERDDVVHLFGNGVFSILIGDGV